MVVPDGLRVHEEETMLVKVGTSLNRRGRYQIVQRVESFSATVYA